MVVQDARKCTHLAAPTILRTAKFVNALAYAPVIMHTDFVDSCLKQNELLDPRDFPLVDKTAESKFHISMRLSANGGVSLRPIFGAVI